MKERYSLGIIGHPIGHSLSPVMHAAAARANGLGPGEFSYERFDVKPDDLATFMRRFRDGAMTGLNVTVPHKVAVMELLDEIDHDAQAIGAVNTIVRRGAKLRGHNTDVYGFIRSIAENAGMTDLSYKKALVYGAGGAARAVARGLVNGGVESLAVVNRTCDTAREMVAKLGGGAGFSAMGFDETKSLIETVRGADIIVNTTSMGMEGGTDPEGVPPGAGHIRSGQLVVDIVYSPLMTPLLKKAAAAGARTLDGLWMLIHQGGKAFEMWTGLRFPDKEVRAAVERGLEIK
ncbi:MAG: shikimate dehydrogenase [Nitrospinae bacterium]|nr:shikimate dehydrogenase [Nitrospinota bacterium]